MDFYFQGFLSISKLSDLSAPAQGPEDKTPGPDPRVANPPQQGNTAGIYRHCPCWPHPHCPHSPIAAPSLLPPPPPPAPQPRVPRIKLRGPTPESRIRPSKVTPQEFIGIVRAGHTHTVHTPQSQHPAYSPPPPSTPAQGPEDKTPGPDPRVANPPQQGNTAGIYRHCPCWPHPHCPHSPIAAPSLLPPPPSTPAQGPEDKTPGPDPRVANPPPLQGNTAGIYRHCPCWTRLNQ